MADITSSNYPVVTDSKSGDQYPIVRNGQLKKQTRDALDEHFATLQYSQFIGLEDTPGTYVGNQGKVPQVNAAQDGLEFVSSSLAPAFITLPDTPSTYGSAGQFLKVNGAANGVEFASAAFTQLSDTPANYTGSADFKVTVNSGATGLEYSPDTFTGHTDTPANYAGSADYFVKVNSGETGVDFVPSTDVQTTGWAQYSDGTYTMGAPFTVAAGVTSNLPNDASSVIETYLPTGVTSLYDGTVITPENIGDAYEIRVSFTASNNNVSGLAALILDIGGGSIVVFDRTFTFPKGVGTAVNYVSSTSFYSLNTFLSTGGTLKIRSDVGTTSIWDISYNIFRIHKGS